MVSVLYACVLVAAIGIVIVAGMYATRSTIARAVMDYSGIVIITVPVIVLIWFFSQPEATSLRIAVTTAKMLP